MGTQDTSFVGNGVDSTLQRKLGRGWYPLWASMFHLPVGEVNELNENGCRKIFPVRI